ncbi:aminotransferase class I/II-fold pyridoxal phosphate-dependent enzyme [Ascidiimonas aurantiaca]|uniref:aminotransferase class I/II-fold pyridoxal phosphate-dependent enzyme n=1 Tax=Ascidiimonas aurantiaca TaxID=1685432 RepID=UPI0030ED6CAE
MRRFPEKLQQKLDLRKNEGSLRYLSEPEAFIDFSSNDYLGFARSSVIFNNSHRYLKEKNIVENGAGGSRLLTGNHKLYKIAECTLSSFFEVEEALIFNSGYDANIGFFASVPQRGDIILYDEYVHASIRDGIAMSHARGYKYLHNSITNLREKIEAVSLPQGANIYVVTESVFSMDGDSPDLKELCHFCSDNNLFLVVDEAHAIGVIGKQGKGLVYDLKLQDYVFAVLVTFGKALGCHGAAVLGSGSLKHYLVNFARSLIYTTALPPHALASFLCAVNYFNTTPAPFEKLRQNILFFKHQIEHYGLEHLFIPGNSAIYSAVVPGNSQVKELSSLMRGRGYEVKPILAPTVPEGKERLRFCIHSYNTENEMKEVLKLLATFAQKK